MPTDTPSRYAILGLLAHGPLSGYAVRQRFAGSLANFWRLSFGQIYPLLRELAAEGLVAPDAGDGDGAGGVAGAGRAPRGRRAYRLTPTGEAALAAWLAEPPAFEQTRSELLLKLAFAPSAPPGALRRHLGDFAARQRARVAQLTAIEAQLRAEAGDQGRPRSGAAPDSAGATAHDDVGAWLLTLDYGITKARALADWAERAERALETDTTPAP
jgi:DNA-binding PadR family transcriptional regulator